MKRIKGTETKKIIVNIETGKNKQKKSIAIEVQAVMPSEFSASERIKLKEFEKRVLAKRINKVINDTRLPSPSSCDGEKKIGNNPQSIDNIVFVD